MQQKIGPTGTIIGVDFTDAMLEQARKRVSRHGWENVRLVHEDMAEFTYPQKVWGILSTFALSTVRIKELEQVVKTGPELFQKEDEWPSSSWRRPRIHGFAG